MNRLVLIAVTLLGLLGSSWAQQPLSFGITGPAGSTPLVISVSGGNQSLVAPLSGASGQFTYICGFIATSGGTSSATTVAMTLSGVSNSPTPMTFEFVFPSTGQGVLGAALGPGCLTSLLVNSTITVTLPAGGSGTSAALTAWGYRL